MRNRPDNKLDLPTPPPGLIQELARRKVLRENELKTLLRTFRPEWGFTQHVRVDSLVPWMLENTPLCELSIRSEVRSSIIRYTWEKVTTLEIAASLAPNAYFSHATAASLLGLLTYKPETIYLNREQSAKPVPEGPLNPDAIERAFSHRQRASQAVYSWDKTRVALLSGKHSGDLGVVSHSLHGDGRVNITAVERTLIDLTVRPDYAGGPAQVLEAFRRSQTRLSVDLLLESLRRLDYRYPYHQAMGFYMERAGYPQTDLAKLRALGTPVDFFVGYAIAEREFDSLWRVHFPRDL